jgi:hypothetical protein
MDLTLFFGGFQGRYALALRFGCLVCSRGSSSFYFSVASTDGLVSFCGGVGSGIQWVALVTQKYSSSTRQGSPLGWPPHLAMTHSSGEFDSSHTRILVPSFGTVWIGIHKDTEQFASSDALSLSSCLLMVVSF